MVNEAEKLEEIFFRVARGGNLTLDDITLLHTAGFDRDKIESEVNRARRVIDAQQRAGTAESRAAARQRLADAESKLAAERDGIEREIQALHAKRKTLELAVSDERRNVETGEKAVDALRKLVPAHVQEFHNMARSLFRQQFGRMRDLQTRAGILRSVTQLSPNSDEARLHLESAKRNDILRTGANGVPSVDERRWAAYLAECRAELETIEPELATLEAEYRDGLAKIDQTLDCYLT